MARIALIIVLLLAALSAGIAIGMTYAEIKHMRVRIAALETSQAKHLPYRTADEIEDATAAILRIKFEKDFWQELVENALEHLQNARGGNGK
jgi:hypothetical protein